MGRMSSCYVSRQRLVITSCSKWSFDFPITASVSFRFASFVRINSQELLDHGANSKISQCRYARTRRSIAAHETRFQSFAALRQCSTRSVMSRTSAKVPLSLCCLYWMRKRTSWDVGELFEIKRSMRHRCCWFQFMVQSNSFWRSVLLSVLLVMLLVLYYSISQLAWDLWKLEIIDRETDFFLKNRSKQIRVFFQIRKEHFTQHALGVWCQCRVVRSAVCCVCFVQSFLRKLKKSISRFAHSIFWIVWIVVLNVCTKILQCFLHVIERLSR